MPNPKPGFCRQAGFRVVESGLSPSLGRPVTPDVEGRAAQRSGGPGAGVRERGRTVRTGDEETQFLSASGRQHDPVLQLARRVNGLVAFSADVDVACGRSAEVSGGQTFEFRRFARGEDPDHVEDRIAVPGAGRRADHDFQLAVAVLVARCERQRAGLVLTPFAYRVHGLCGGAFHAAGQGPLAGFGEIELPALQPGSSIMPGKVNPVIPEMVLQVSAQVIGNDAAITQGGQAGNFELNVMLPLLAYNLIQSIQLLAAAVRAFGEKCIRGIEADVEKCASNLERSLALATAFVPIIGYDKAAWLAGEAFAKKKTIRETALENRIRPEEEIHRIIDTIIGKEETD